MIFLWFLAIFILYLVTILVTLIGSFATAKLHWINSTKIAINIFEKEINNKYWVFFIKEKIHRYLLWFYLFVIINIASYVMFTWLWIIVWEDYWYLIGFTSLFIISYLVFFILIKKFIRDLKNIGMFNQKVTLEKFKAFISMKNDNKPRKNIDFCLYKNGKYDPFNKMIIFHQKRFTNKINTILNENNSDNQTILKLSEFFSLYLRRWGFFVMKLKNQSDDYYLEINGKRHEINQLPKILINNFFVVINSLTKF